MKRREPLVASVAVQGNRQRRKGRFSRLAVCAVAIVAACSCGSILSGCFGSGSDADPSKVLSDTFNQPHRYASGKLDASLLMDGPAITGNGGKLALSLKGPFSSNGKGTVPSFDLVTALGLGGKDAKFGLISDGKAMWMDIGGVSYQLPTSVFDAFSTSWTGRGSSSSASSNALDRLGFHPQGWITSPETVGEENVAGQPTVHVKAKVDGSKLVGDLGSLLGSAGQAGGALLGLTGIGADVKAKVAKAIETAQVDVWSGKTDGALRKLKVEIAVKGIDGGKPTRVELLITLAELNVPQTIAKPSSSRQFSELAGLLSGVGGLVGNSPSTSPDPSALSYERCVAAAANLDAAKRCNGLLTS
jgi:hypothetical protein